MQTYKGRLRTLTILFMAAFHILAAVAIITLILEHSWQMICLSAAVWFVIGCLGIGVGFHRYFTHSGFKTHKWIEYFLAICGCIGMQGGPAYWVAAHRKHHKFAEVIGHDPHTPLEGKFWAHMGWLMHTRDEESELISKWAPDLWRQKFYARLNDWHWLPLATLGMIILAIANWKWMLFGTVIPVTWSWHMTWLVNSAGHCWGARKYGTEDDSRNNILVAWVTFGEGWHNNHHHDPRAARHSRRWYEYDSNWYTIKFLELIHLAWDVKAPKTERVALNT